MKPLQERQREMRELAAKVNAGRKPEFGDLMMNPWASDGNPHRDGFFVRVTSKTGRVNPGIWYEMTDRKGSFWEVNGNTMMFCDNLTGDEVFP